MNTPLLSDKMPLAAVHAKAHLAFLSHDEIDRLIHQSDRGLYPLIRNCALAVLNSGTDSDDSLALFAKHPDFEIEFNRHPRGLQLLLHNAPKSAFVDDHLIESIHRHLFSVLRDLIYVRNLHPEPQSLQGKDATNLIFQILRNAHALTGEHDLSMAVCWGGHSVNQVEYEYSKEVGRALGLRRFDVCTGCGPGAMKGPMRGAMYSHRRQGYTAGRFVGITEPQIIAAEPPNGAVSELIIMPDIEKRLEAFVRIAHALIIFPGGAGTFEELLYLIAILLDPANASDPIPVVLTGPADSAPILHAYTDFIRQTLGDKALERIRVITGDADGVARYVAQQKEALKAHRLQQDDAYYFNWTLTIPSALQQGFEPTHENMARLDLRLDQSPEHLAATLRKLFSGIVAGNVKPATRQAIEYFGPFQLSGHAQLIHALDTLLTRLVSENRMKLRGGYTPCYQFNPVD